MFNNPTSLLLLGGSTILIGILMVLAGIWLVRDHPPSTQRLTWHHLLKDSIHVSLLDEDGKIWILDIFYNENITSPTHNVQGERKMQIQLPVNYRYKDFVNYARNISLVHDKFEALVNGVYEESRLKNLHFTKRDLSEYREFKRHLLLKALRN